MIELLAACGAWVWVFILKIQYLHPALYRKPFSCEVCLAGWFTMLLSAGYYRFEVIPFKMAAAMVLTILLTKLMNKI